jgi:bifunctional DNA-binding transcriptional regulator/antitoxin component of YhaV-PrlF toxin-antitoxin module
MAVTTSKLSSKFQVTVPSWVRKQLGAKVNSEIVWIQTKPGEVVVLARDEGKDPLLELCGKYQDDSWDSVEEIRKSRNEDLILEQRKYGSA